MKFNVGDKVKLVGDIFIPKAAGKVGEITELMDGTYLIENIEGYDYNQVCTRDEYLELVEKPAENSGQESPDKDDRKLQIELEIECLESQVERYKLKMHQAKARLEAYREFLEMLEQE